MPTVERPEPPYQQIARSIRERIAAGELVPGEALPPVREIAESWDVAHATAARAITELRTTGYVTTTSRGSFVARRLHGPQGYARAVMRRGKIYPEGHYAVIQSAGLVPAGEVPESILEALGIAPTSPAIRRERVTYGPDDKPLSTSTSWFDGSLAEQAPLLLEPARILQGTTAYVAEMTGRVRSATERATVKASRATNTDAERLGVKVGEPVLRGRNWYWDAHGGVLEYGESASGEELEEEFEYNVEGDQST